MIRVVHCYGPDYDGPEDKKNCGVGSDEYEAYEDMREKFED